MKKYGFSDRAQGGLIQFLQGAKSILDKGQIRKFRGQQVLFGTKFLIFVPKRANLATLVVPVIQTIIKQMHYDLKRIFMPSHKH